MKKRRDKRKEKGKEKNWVEKDDYWMEGGEETRGRRRENLMNYLNNN